MILKQQHTLHCPICHTPRLILLTNIRNIIGQILSHGKDQLIQTFLYGNPNCNLTVNIGSYQAQQLISNIIVPLFILSQVL